MAIGRQLPNFIASIVRGYRFDPLALMSGKVVIRQIAAMLFHKGVDRFGDRAFVKLIAAPARNFLESGRQQRVTKEFAFLRSSTITQERFLESGVAFQACASVPVVGDQLRNGKPFFGIADGGR